jgi:hypothetical protein
MICIWNDPPPERDMIMQATWDFAPQFHVTTSTDLVQNYVNIQTPAVGINIPVNVLYQAAYLSI